MIKLNQIPGSSTLQAGTMEQGYFGVVKEGLPNGEELANIVGITQGTPQFSDEGYLKFAYKGKILFKSKKPFRYNLSWDDINAQNCVLGRIIEYQSVKYKVRLMQGLDPNRMKKNSQGYYEESGRNCYHSEWNMLMLPIHERAKDYSWKYKDNVYNSEIPQDWGINFTDEDLMTHYNYGNGGYQWCQETVYSSTSRLYRGGIGASYAYYTHSFISDNDRGWSPVLEVLEYEYQPPKISKINLKGTNYNIGNVSKTIDSINNLQGEVTLTTANISYKNTTLASAMSAKVDKVQIKNSLKDYAEDSAHRTITDTEKQKWDSKLDKMDGKGLTTLDFTNEDKSKLALVDDKCSLADLKVVEDKITNYKFTPLVQFEIDTKNMATDIEVLKITDTGQMFSVASKKTVINKVTIPVDTFGKYRITWKNSIVNGYTTVEVNKAKIYRINIVEETKAPGNKMLLRGDMAQGYFGVVKDNLPDGNKLAELCGITAGTSQFPDEGYLKFAYKGRVLFKSKKPFRHTISWNNLNEKGCVFGKEITYNGVKYKVRLMEGHDPNRQEKRSSGSFESHGQNCYHSEWNMLMLPIHIRAKRYDWNFPGNVDNSEIPNDWNINFSDEELLTHHNYGNGNWHLCQDADTATDIARGYTGVSAVGTAGLNNSNDSDIGWSPVLEVVG